MLAQGLQTNVMRVWILHRISVYHAFENYNYLRECKMKKLLLITAMVFASTGAIAQEDSELLNDASKVAMDNASGHLVQQLEGSEAGGHIGQVSLAILLQQVLFHNPSVPVFVAGGIATGKMIAHLLLMGAAGCQMGTRFVMSEECTAHPEFKKRFAKARAREAISTPSFDRVRLPVVAVRALQNKGMEAFGDLQMKLLTQLDDGDIRRDEAQLKVEEFWMGALRNAVVDGNVDGGSLMAGQSVGLIDSVDPMEKIFSDLLTEAEEELLSVKALLDS